ncbi:MAG: hypothetical protein Q9P14_05120 [candidate division KSB1 bacterium]|nr:hypothetical protein [candidate division KSB1 bacterium]
MAIALFMRLKATGSDALLNAGKENRRLMVDRDPQKTKKHVRLIFP